MRRLMHHSRSRPALRIGKTASALIGGAVVAVAMATSAAPLDPSLRQAVLAQGAQQLRDGQGAAAYRSLLEYENALAGSVEFDFLFGQAALAADEPSRAAFAFERCLASEPRHGACRLGMARAHIMLTEVPAARNELEWISQSAPPPEVLAIVADYMSRLTGKVSENQDTRLSSYVQVGIGHDSNMNAATAQSSLAIPVFNNLIFNLSRDGQERDSFFNQAQFNINYSTPLSAHWRLLAEGNVSTNLYWESNTYNTLVSDVSVGVARRENRHQFTLKAQGQNYRLGEHSYRNLVSLLGQYAYSVSDRSEVNGFMHVSRVSYPGAPQNAANRYVGGASWSQSLANNRAIVYVSAYGGQEVAVQGDAPDEVNYRLNGARLGGMALLTPRTQLEAGVGLEQRHYDGRDSLFLTGRRDTLYDGFIGVNHALSRKVSIRPNYRYIRSESTIPLRDYQRHIFMVNLRYELF